MIGRYSWVNSFHEPVFLRVYSKTNFPVTFFITIRGDLHHCVGVPIAAIKMLIDAAFRNGT
jgi:hypothetical protein